MMKGSTPESASMPMPPSLACAVGAFVPPKSGLSRPVHFSPFQKTYFLRSLHGDPSGLADARLYMMRRFAGHEKPQSRLGVMPPVLSGLRFAARSLSGAGKMPQ